MLVSHILKAKGAAVHTAPPMTPVSEAVATLAEKRIGVLVVTDEAEGVIGILSERDIVHALGARGASCLSDPIEALMTRDPTCTDPGARGEQVLTRMTEGRFRHMPVLEDGKLVGMVSLGDVVKARLDELAMENASMQGMIMGH